MPSDSVVFLHQQLKFALKIFNYFFTSVFILEAIVKITALGVMIYMKDRYDINPFFTSVFILVAIVKITAIGVMIYIRHVQLRSGYGPDNNSEMEPGAR